MSAVTVVSLRLNGIAQIGSVKYLKVGEASNKMKLNRDGEFFLNFLTCEKIYQNDEFSTRPFRELGEENRGQRAFRRTRDDLYLQRQCVPLFPELRRLIVSCNYSPGAELFTPCCSTSNNTRLDLRSPDCCRYVLLGDFVANEFD